MKPLASLLLLAMAGCAAPDSIAPTAPCGPIPGFRLGSDSLTDWRVRLLYQTEHIPPEYQLVIDFSYWRMPDSTDAATVATYGGQVTWYWVERGASVLSVSIDAAPLRRYVTNEPLPDVYAAVVSLPVCPMAERPN